MTQLTFLRAFRHMDRFRGEASMKTWLFSIARNTLLSSKRNTLARRTEILSLEEDRVEVPKSEDQSPLASVLSEEMMKLLAEAMARLPPRMKQVVYLRVVKEMEYIKIAKVLRINLNTVKSTLSQARSRLKMELGEYFDDIDL